MSFMEEIDNWSEKINLTNKKNMPNNFNIYYINFDIDHRCSYKKSFHRTKVSVWFDSGNRVIHKRNDWR